MADGQDRKESQAKRQKILAHFSAPILPAGEDEAPSDEGAVDSEAENGWVDVLSAEKAADAELRKMRKTAKAKSSPAGSMVVVPKHGGAGLVSAASQKEFGSSNKQVVASSLLLRSFLSAKGYTSWGSLVFTCGCTVSVTQFLGEMCRTCGLFGQGPSCGLGPRVRLRRASSSLLVVAYGL